MGWWWQLLWSACVVFHPSSAQFQDVCWVGGLLSCLCCVGDGCVWWRGVPLRVCVGGGGWLGPLGCFDDSLVCISCLLCVGEYFPDLCVQSLLLLSGVRVRASPRGFVELLHQCIGEFQPHLCRHFPSPPCLPVIHPGDLFHPVDAPADELCCRG